MTGEGEVYTKGERFSSKKKEETRLFSVVLHGVMFSVLH